MLTALAANLRMIRRMAEIYGGRAGAVGGWRLARTVMTHLIATGAVGYWVGEVALLNTSERSFRVVLQVALTLLGLQLLWRAAQSAGLI